MADSTVMLKEDLIIHHKCFRSGTVFFVVGWREIHETPYIILSKGSWEGIIELNYIHDKIDPLNK